VSAASVDASVQILVKAPPYENLNIFKSA